MIQVIVFGSEFNLNAWLQKEVGKIVVRDIKFTSEEASGDRFCVIYEMMQEVE